MQNRISDQPAFILHRRDYQNSSLILEIFSEDYGRLSVLAKGAKKRRDAGHFQLCQRLSIGWTGRSELKTLTAIDSRPFAVSPDGYMAVFYINELLLYLLPKHDEYRNLFQCYQLLLLQLAQQEFNLHQLEPLLRGFEIDMLTELGLMPDLKVEGVDNRTVLPESRYIVNAQSGLQRCGNTNIKSYKGADILAIQQRRFEPEDVLKTAKKLLRQIIDYNLQGRELQSRKFYQQLKHKKST